MLGMVVHREIASRRDAAKIVLSRKGGTPDGRSQKIDVLVLRIRVNHLPSPRTLLFHKQLPISGVFYGSINPLWSSLVDHTEAKAIG